MTDVPGLDSLLSAEGWPYASTVAVEPGDPGRFHALFGRDSLITSLQVLPARPDVAAATLRALASLQGTRDDGATHEQPGKIGHEFRATPPASFVEAGWPDGGEFRYYGTADATSWFLVLLAAVDDIRLANELELSWRAAGEWLRRTLESGNGLVRHGPGTVTGDLTQQGWRDTIDPAASPTAGGILRAYGSVPTPPIADADTQAVTVAALRALARLSGQSEWRERADQLRALVTARFLPDVMLVEAGDQPVPGAGSQLGWLLWAGAVEPSAVADVATRLCQPDIVTPFGLRTLSSDAPTFDAQAYHRGSVWPFDSWLGWGGLRAAGRLDEAELVRRGVLDAIERLGRYPELYAVSPAGELAPIPIANRIQAWTVGAGWALANEWDGRPH